MKFLPITLGSIAENLALDEAMMESAEQGFSNMEVLRLWEAESKFIVVGRSSKVDVEVQRPLAESLDIPIYRRVSGGTSIVADTGCLFYSVLLDLETRPHLRMLNEAHRFVMTTLLKAIRPLRPDVQLQGTCDLVIGGSPDTGSVGSERKVSGNSLRVGRRWMLYHGTLLVDMDLQWIAKLLKHPPREPDYRGGRDHASFLANLDVDPNSLRDALRNAWRAEEAFSPIPQDIVDRLVRERYLQRSWNYQR